MQGVLATIAITDAEMKDTVDTVEVLGTGVADLELRLATTTEALEASEARIAILESRMDNQVRLDKKQVLGYVELTVTKMLAKGILAMDTSDPVERQMRKLNGPLRDMIKRRDIMGQDGEGSGEIFTNEWWRSQTFVMKRRWRAWGMKRDLPWSVSMGTPATTLVYQGSCFLVC